MCAQFQFYPDLWVCQDKIERRNDEMKWKYKIHSWQDEKGNKIE